MPPLPSIVYHEIDAERRRAHEKHRDNGGSMETKDWNDPAWLPVLTEEVGEVARVLCEVELGNVDAAEARRQLREELIQVAAMATAWVRALDDDYRDVSGRLICGTCGDEVAYCGRNHDTVR